MSQGLFAWFKRYERHLSALAMLAGFVWDNLFFGRVDVWQTQAVFAAYTGICFVAIALNHYLSARPEGAPKWAVLLPISTQFALGGFWSGFVIFYGRSADVGSSWPFLLFLLLVLLGSEYFHRYHARLVFTSVLFFFALYSYAIFAVPIYTGTLGSGTFLMSTLAAVGIFALFTVLLRILARERFFEDVWRIRAGAALVLVLVLISYATNILPPLPLSAEEAGVYHSVTRGQTGYSASAEPQSWAVRYLGFTPTLHVGRGESLYAYAAVFAPTILTTTIVDRWQRYDPTLKKWVDQTVVRYAIAGGREGGYRGYTTARVTPGSWRVSVETSDGRHIVRLPFDVEAAPSPAPLETITLK